MVILMVLLLGVFVAILNQTLLNVAIPHLMTAFNVSADTVQWLSTAYMLTTGVLVPLSAFLIGTFTTRQLFIISMVLFTAGSFICSISPTFGVMLLGRITQAAGGGVMMPLMMTVILDLFPPQTRGKAMGTMAIALFFAPAIGPTLSGWMIEHWSWRLLFYVVIPIALIDLVMAVFLLPNVETPGKKPKLDAWGAITSIIGFSTLLYGFSEAGSKGWSDSVVISSISIGVVFVILFIVQEVRSQNPMLNLRVFRFDIFTLTTVVGALINMAMFGAMILTPIYMQNIRGFTPLQSGLAMLPGALLMGIMSPISGALFDRLGARPLAVIGLLITAITTWQFTKLTSDTSYAHVMWLYTFRMFGMSFIAMTIQTAGLNQLPREYYSHGTAASNTARQVASSLGTAILVSVMTTRTQVHYADYQNVVTINNPHLAQNLAMLSQGFAVKMGLPTAAGQSVTDYLLYSLAMQQSTIEGINDAFWWATIGTIIALILSLFIRRVKFSAVRTQPPKPAIDDSAPRKYLNETRADAAAKV
ncbi:DHA2 family efflux MFS transporter permease subunit [Alicyclobacillus contaminans]|uniref:DHA2 family efflux MFS transporter permease subunit n=1 Tax=Alicyclobacillus contaminans TaxID=392016 RepID=UPI0009FDDF9F|nr:DHA2 family efflux MFS transporter permease subunit [Alicyclobacillus contaminans]